jgi:ribose/xylose/arabinose/galactoside ABC-type transport system permease subunit
MTGAYAARLRPYLMPFLVLSVTWLVMATSTKEFRGEGSVFAVLEGFTLLGLVALGVELDLSVGSIAAMAGIIAVRATEWGFGLAGSVLVAFGICLAIGATQGFCIALLGINSLVFTVGTLILFRGVTYLLSGGPNGQAPRALEDFSLSDALLERHWVFSVSSIVALCVFAVVGSFLAYTRYGREIYAIGGARPEALSAGIRTWRPLTIAFAISAGCAGLAGALASIRGGAAAPESYEELLLAGVAGAALGGVSLWGGRGTVLNVVIGVLVLSVVTASLAVRGAQGSTVQLITGALLLGVIALEFVEQRTAGGALGRLLRRPVAHSP